MESKSAFRQLSERMYIFVFRSWSWRLTRGSEEQGWETESWRGTRQTWRPSVMWVHSRTHGSPPTLSSDGGQVRRTLSAKIPTRSAHVCVCARSLQSCPTLCNPVNCGPPGSPVQGTLQASILGWAANPTPYMLSFSTSTGSLKTQPWAHFFFFFFLWVQRGTLWKNVRWRDDKRLIAVYTPCELLPLWEDYILWGK